MHKAAKGFTVIEMIVVIVIIAILASITYVAYNGAQDRAKNAQTVSAAEQWIKALQISKVRNGTFPSVVSCLGANYNYNYDNAGSSGIGQCRQDNSSYGVTTNSTFYAALDPYITGNPTPAMISAVNTSTAWYRGLYYYIGAGNVGRVDFTLTSSASSCPDQVGGVANFTAGHTTDGDWLCTYAIGSTLSY
jgi:general secretion pathway protein G